MSREAWRDVCLEFYRNGEGKEVLEWYDALKTGGNSTMKVPKEFDLFTNIDFQDFDRIRNETRRLFHAENAQKNVRCRYSRRQIHSFIVIEISVGENVESQATICR